MADEHRFLERSRAVQAASPACLNCGTMLTGPFCAECGQRDIPPYPNVRELAVDAVSEFSGWDGRLLSTMRALIRRPGLLTHEFLEGRRARYISPLKLYLTASLVYFVVAAAAPNVRVGSGKPMGLRVATTTTGNQPPAPGPQRVANAAEEALNNPDALTSVERQAALKDIERAPALMKPLLRRAVGDPVGFKRGMATTMPRMLFVLLPIFAAILAIFYRRRKYPEHLYFAIHLHAFIFLALTVAALMKFTRLAPLVIVGSLIAVCWIPIYATLSFRRVYGGSLGRTLAKEMGIFAIYALTAAAAMIVTVYWVSIAT